MGCLDFLFSGGKTNQVLLHRRENSKIALDSAGIVVTDVAFNHLNQFQFAGKAPAVVAFPLQDTPKALHRAIVNTMSYAGHALCHAGLLQLVVKSPVGILEASVTVEQRMGIRIRLDSLVKGLVDKWIIIALADHIGHDAPVIEIQNGAQIELVYSNPLIPFNSVTSVSHFSLGFAA